MYDDGKDEIRLRTRRAGSAAGEGGAAVGDEGAGRLGVVGGRTAALLRGGLGGERVGQAARTAYRELPLDRRVGRRRAGREPGRQLVRRRQYPLVVVDQPGEQPEPGRLG